MLDGLSPARQTARARRRRPRPGGGRRRRGALWATRDEAVRPASQGDARPGAARPRVRRGTAALDVLADALRAQGREVVVVDLPGDDTGDLDEQARRARPGRGPGDAAHGRAVGRRGRLLGRRRGRRGCGSATTAAATPPGAWSPSARRTTAPTWRGSAATSLRTSARRPASSCSPTATCCAGSTPATRPRPARSGCRSGPPTTRRRAAGVRPSLEGAVDFTMQSVCPGAVVEPRRPAAHPAR